MRRLARPVAHVVRVLYALWLAFVLVQPVSVHACAMRKTIGEAQRILASGGIVCDPMAKKGAGHETQHEQGSSSGHQHVNPNDCQCIGDCSAPVAVLPTVPPSTVPVPERIARIATIESLTDVVVSAPDHLRPPATAPPATPVA